MGALELASNYDGTRTHWSADLKDGYQPAGRHGHSICSQYVASPTCVYDQEAMDAVASFWGLRKPKRISELPVCKLCVRKLPALGIQEGGRP
jgi:hypothetical protein